MPTAAEILERGVRDLAANGEEGDAATYVARAVVADLDADGEVAGNIDFGDSTGSHAA